MKTELSARILWFDGTSQVDPDLVPVLFLSGVSPSKIVVTETNEDIEQFNLLSDIAIEIGKSSNSIFNMEYNIPEFYKNIDLEKYLESKDIDLIYKERVAKELVEIKSRGMEMLIRTLIYVIDTLIDSKTVWGVGRGSSCASLVLFLIGLHKVDPIKYNIPMEEFFHS